MNKKVKIPYNLIFCPQKQGTPVSFLRWEFLFRRNTGRKSSVHEGEDDSCRSMC